MIKDLIKTEEQTNLNICARMMSGNKISSTIVVDNKWDLMA
jgi:hypothetical protein